MKLRRVKEQAEVEGIPIPVEARGKTLSLGKLGRAFPHVSAGPSFVDDVSDPVVLAERPSVTEHQTLTHDADNPALIDGVWTIVWVVEDKVQDAEYIENHRRDISSRISEKRWKAENGGMTVGDTPIDTDLDSVNLITATMVGMGRDPTAVVDWQDKDKNWNKVNKASIEGMHDAVFAHRQSARTNEFNLDAEVVAATTIAELDAIDIESGWPSND